MGIKILLLAFVILVEVWVGSCCVRRCEKNGKFSTCFKRKPRSTTLMHAMKTDVLTKIGTQFINRSEDNLCAFETYDIDNDGSISKDELETKLGVNKESTYLFSTMKTGEGDTPISFSEFCATIPHLISECARCSYD